MAKKATGLLKCEARAETPGKPADPNADGCTTRSRRSSTAVARPRAASRSSRRRTRTTVSRSATRPLAEAAVDACVATLVAAIDPPPLDQTKCGAAGRSARRSIWPDFSSAGGSRRRPGSRPIRTREAGSTRRGEVQRRRRPRQGVLREARGEEPERLPEHQPLARGAGSGGDLCRRSGRRRRGSAGTTSPRRARAHHTTRDVTTSTTPHDTRRSSRRARRPHTNRRSSRRARRFARQHSTACSGATDGTPCDDGSLCTINDHCAHGACVGDSKCGAMHGVADDLQPRHRPVFVRDRANRDGLRSCADRPRMCAAQQPVLNGICTDKPAARRHTLRRRTESVRPVSTCQGGRCVSGALRTRPVRRRESLHPDRPLSGRHMSGSSEELR
jgi:hypothetical protein